LGLECAGIVAEVGRGVDLYKIGDRVGALSSGAFTTSHVAPQDFCFKIPDMKSIKEAAGILHAYRTAIHALVEKGKLESGMVSSRLNVLYSLRVLT